MEERKFDLIAFTDKGFSLDVRVDPDEDTVWLTQTEMAKPPSSSDGVLSKHDWLLPDLDDDGIEDERYLQRLKRMLGKRVEVKVDRPLGSAHPLHPDIVYPVNYGYIEPLLAPDGDYQDAYILGIHKAVPSFSGVVIAVIRRLDDIEGKLVVAPEGVSYSDEEILKEVAFQEQYFESVLLR